ncbi:MAG: hypothetical protein OEW33_00595, partial [Nitrospirota bacterium]|nr:hypothetical protein [Nitrospirota bacterium]
VAEVDACRNERTGDSVMELACLLHHHNPSCELSIVFLFTTFFPVNYPEFLWVAWLRPSSLSLLFA